MKKEQIMAKVGIVMGSDSDMPIMAKAADVLKELGIDWGSRTCTSTPCWHKSAVAFSGGCSRKEEPCTEEPMSIWTPLG